MAKKKEIDITKTGPQSYRDLQKANAEAYKSASKVSKYAGVSSPYSYNRPSDYVYEGEEHSPLYIQSKGADYWGNSIFDQPTATEDEFQNLGDVRAENQPWYAQIGAGLAKGAILAGTTFLDGTVGLIAGIGTAASEDKWSGLWDNDFSRTMQSLNNWSEQVMPNYYTQEELERPFWENIFTENFLGDKFIKNLGFTIGALYSGGLVSAGLRGIGGMAVAGAKRLGAGINTIKNITKANSIVAAGVGSFASALNEGRIEALNNSKDWFNLHKLQIDDSYEERLQAIKDQYEGTEIYDQLVAAENERYEQALKKLSEDRAKMGNADLLMNIPILMASNLVQFGKLYANGFKTAKKSLNIAGKPGQYIAEDTKRSVAPYILKNALSEGSEEFAQGIASRVSGNYYSTDVNNFYKAKMDPDASQETLSWTKAFAKGINETINDNSAWEEFFIGGVTGALGIPRFRGIRNAEGNLQSPVTIYNEGIRDWREHNKMVDRENAIADYMNNRVSSPEFLNYYQGLVRHNKYQNDMNTAAEQGDEFNFKNAEHAQLVSDITMFDEAGKLEDLKSAIAEASDTSVESLESIIKNTTSKNDEGNLVGPFSEYASTDDQGNIIANFGSQESIDKMAAKINSNKEDILNAINTYQEAKNSLQLNYGDRLNDEQLKELVWMTSQIDNWYNRSVAMSGDVKSAIGNILGNLDSLLRFNTQIRDLEVQTHADLTGRYRQADENIKAIQGAINTLNLVRNQNDKTLAYTLATNPKFVDGLIKEINNVDESILSEEKKQDIITKLHDVVKLGNASKTYNAKLKEYLENPQKQTEDHAKADEQAAQQETKKKSDDLKTSLNAAQNLQEFRDIIDSQDDIENRDNVLKEMEDEGNAMAKNYRETSQYNNEVRRVLNESDAEPQVKQDAMKLIQDQFNNSENLEQLANPNSIYINNENAFDEDSEGNVELSATRFQNAQYELQKVMSKVNNDNRFKDRFSTEYKKPVEKREGPTRGDDRSTTGDSGTTTTPIVTSSEGLPTTELPVGNITAEMVNEENKKANERIETPQRPSRDTLNQFYRPAIPELHIEASKEGDFRPFVDVVAEREKGADFSDIYNYLRDKGAFEYLNQGKLHVGDEIGFMIDPEFEERVKDKEWHKAPTIFMIDKKSGQVVGSLDESDYSASRYEGLKGLEERIRSEYANRENKTGKFVATPTTKVSKMMTGRIPYDNTERSLKDIPNVSGENRAPVFGIIKNGILTTNSKIADNLIIKPVDVAQKEGRLYLLIPNGAGKYSPAAVRVKHFNNEEFNLDDVIVSNTPIGKDISVAIAKLANATSQDDVSAAMQDLSQDLYMQDVMITWFDGRTGSGIIISKKIRKPDGTYEKVIINGKEQIKEDKHDIYYASKEELTTLGSISLDSPDVTLEKSGESELKQNDSSDIYKEILGYLNKFNLPLQVSTRRINNGAYNNRLVNSGILTSNITDASVRGTWFTTDYFDNEGNLHQAISPASVTPKPKRKIETPVGGTEGAIAGTKITSVFSNKTYYVDLKTNTIRDDQGKSVKITNDNRILFDLAWAQDNFGSSMNSIVMVDNKALTPGGKILDRTTQKYITGQEAQDVKDAIAGRKREREDRVAKSKEVISEIYENQKRVDKTRTDGEFYYILEDGGQYHEYSRVHSRLGSNWVESPKQTEALIQVRTKLSQLVDTPAQYSNYLKFLENKYKINLDGYQGKTDAKSRDAIVNTVRDLMSGTNSMRALNAGTAVDSVIRQYFTVRDVAKIVRPNNMTENAFIDLITNLNRIKSNMEQMGERFLADNIVLFQKYPDNTRVAGEVDILSVDKNGNFKIYDVKTSRYSFYEFTDRYGHKVNYFTTPSATQRMSAKDYYTLQLSAYKNLFESQYGVPVTKLAVMPFVLNYEKENVSGVQSEKGIPVTYNPAVNVPLVGNVKVDKPVEAPAIPEQEPPLLPIYDSSLELQNPIEDLAPEYSMSTGDDESVGYFEIDGKLHKGYMTRLTVVDGIPVEVTKVPNITRGLSGKDTPRVVTNDYYAVFPNGNTVRVIQGAPVSTPLQEIEDKMRQALENSPQRVKDESSKKTILFDPNAVPTVNTASINTVETPDTINQGTTQTGAAYTTQKEQAINNKKASRSRHKLRAADIKRPVWNQEQELNWLNKVLPQLSESDRVKVMKGLIKVGRQGALAWGQFDNSVITLSDIAAEGTTYHEAFHAVFNLLLDQNERQALYDEAKKLYGDKDTLSLEEDMAEGFREYVMTRQNRGLGRRILDFFKELFTKVTNWNNFRPSLISYYQRINEGKYVNSNFKVPTINEVKAVKYRKVDTESIHKSLDDEYNKAVKIIQRLNNTHIYNTEEEALRAFRDSGINNELFYRVTKKGANNAKGHKIQLLTKEQFNNYKESIIEKEEVLNMERAENKYFDSLDPNIQMGLFNKGWTKEKFDSISQEERDHALRCIAF